MSPWKLTASQRRRFWQQLKRCRDARQYRRLLAVLEVDGGEPVAHVARRLGVSRQSVHQWMRACQGGGSADLLEDERRSGRPSRWNETRRTLLRHWLDSSPERYGYVAASWTVALLAEQIRHAWGEEISQNTLRHELHRLGYSWKRSRYVLEPDPEREKKTPNSPVFQAIGAAEHDFGRG